MDRVATFKQFIQQKPEEPFPRYGLAMEYRNTGQFEKAQKVFDTLLEKFPDYLAAYQMAGNNLVDLGRKPDAAEVFRRGVEVSKRQGDERTTAELQASLEEVGG